MIKASIVFAMLLTLTACDATKSDFPIGTDAVKQEVETLSTNVTVVKLTAQNIDLFAQSRDQSAVKTNIPAVSSSEYLIGKGDVLIITVWDHQELSTPQEGSAAGETGVLIKSDGTFFFPFAGQVDAAGLDVETVRQNLTLKLQDFIPNPQITIRVKEFNSQYVSVTGQVQNPIRTALDGRAQTLLEAVDAAGGLKETADASAVTIRRQGQIYNVDLQAFLEHGNSINNPVLVRGDIINVPLLEKEEAYLLGQIVTPSSIDLTKTNVTLTEALTTVGGLKEDQADARGIFVFRSTDAGITVYQLDASNPAAFLLGTKFNLLPQDVIYVTTAPLYRWNRLISSLLPTVNVARAAQ
jgi:polysaccharide export outer membrane protein